MAIVHTAHTARTPGIAQALFGVFVQPMLSRQTTSRTIHPQVLQRNIAPSTRATRPFSTSLTQYAALRSDQKRTQKWDDEITAPVVQLVDVETNKLSEPMARWSVLHSYDRATHRLIQLTPDDPKDPDSLPLCKIISKKDEYDRAKRLKESQKGNIKVIKAEKSIKTLEINWAIDPNDLGHRLSQMKGFLEEGRKVEIVFAAKKATRRSKGGRLATPEECEELFKKVQKAAEEVQGARQTKPLDGKMGGFALTVFQGKVQKTE